MYEIAEIKIKSKQKNKSKRVNGKWGAIPYKDAGNKHAYYQILYLSLFCDLLAQY
jgi:hypothetical protein